MVMFTTDPIYKKPLVPRITIKSLDGGTTYYTYDPWTDVGTATKAVACNVSLSQNHHGTFTIQIEDETKAISSNVNLGARVLIECGKQSTQMTRLLSGVIRQKGYTRGADKKVLYTLSGSSTAIRFNERISYFVREAVKLAQDNITIDINDPLMKADTLLQSALNIASETSYYNAAGIGTSSDVENFIPSVAVEYGELQDIINLIEEQSNGEVFVDVNDVVQFRHQLQSAASGRGFTIKNKNATNDNADDTCYLRGRNWNYTESALKSDSYSSRLFGILPTEQLPSEKEDLGWGNPIASFGNTTAGVEYAQKFRPTHGFWRSGDVYIVGSEFGSSGGSAWPQQFRICNDAGGVPQNTNGIVGNIIFYNNGQWPDIVTAGSAGTENLYRLTNDAIFYNAVAPASRTFDLDTTKDYWLICANLGIIAAGSRTFAWALDSRPSSATGGMQHTSNFSTALNGGSSWTNVSGKPCFAMPRRRSESFECSDPKAISALAGSTNSAFGVIESTLSNTPALVKTRQAMYKYMINQVYYMARPRSNWNMATVTAPNVPIMPNDPIMISDSVLGFSTAGTQAVMTTCGDMTYSWNIGDYQAPTILSIQPVGLVTRYR